MQIPMHHVSGLFKQAINVGPPCFEMDYLMDS